MSAFAALAREAAAVATGRLGWPPALFWDATPAELWTALGGRAGDDMPAPLGRAELERLRGERNDG